MLIFFKLTKNFNYKIFLLIILCNIPVSSLELRLTIPLYESLSKTVYAPVYGSSSIIIDRKDLKKYENIPIHDILSQESGIKSRSIYGTNSSGSKTTLDIRGMGAQSKSNVLILINGQRLNNIDMSEIDFPSIPIDSIDRIEIIKGNAASVLYGDGAIGGIINIITNPEIHETNKNEVILKTGTFSKRELVWKNFQNLGNYSLSIFFNTIETDGYRDQNEQQQNNLSSELKFPGNNGDHLFTLSFNEQKMSTPSDRDQDQLFNDRRGSDTPDDFINSVGGSILYGADYKLSDDMTFIFNSSFRLKDSFSDLQSSSYPSYNETSLTNYQITPRINYLTNFFGKISKSTYGLDIQHADYSSYRKKTKDAIPLHVYDAFQTSQSAYTQQSIFLTDSITFGAGIRLQRNHIVIEDDLNTNAPDYGGWQTEHKRLADNEINYAANLGLEYQLYNNTTIYGRLGNGFRYPNIDDRIGGSGGTSLELNTQKTQDFEIGLKFASNKFTSNISTYVIEGKNEISYDTDAFQNINMNSTRRYGIELNTRNKIKENLNLVNNFTFSKAKYTSGDQGSYATDFKGNDVPLVPQYSLDTSLEWVVSKFTKVIPSIKYQDDMRMESDDENFQNVKIPSYVIANLSFTSQFNKLFYTLSINNIFDKKFYNYAVSSSNTLGRYNAYPEPGREILFSIGTRF